jgi:hypothetical protein
LLNVDQDARPTIEKVLRQPIVRQELRNIMNDFMALISDYSTADIAHKVLNQIVEIQCMLAE